jgi:hypothetical protein
MEVKNLVVLDSCDVVAMRQQSENARQRSVQHFIASIFHERQSFGTSRFTISLA